MRTPTERTNAIEALDDERLLARVLQRDCRAWRELERRIRPGARLAIRKVAGRFPSLVTLDDEQDMYAQLLIELTDRDMQKLRAHDASRGRSLLSWISLLSTNVAWDHLRRLQRLPIRDEQRPEDLCAAENPHDVLSTKQRWAALSRAISQLPPGDQTFFQLFYVEGRDADEVAEHMHTTVSTVYCRKRRLLHRLLEAIGLDEGFEPAALLPA